MLRRSHDLRSTFTKAAWRGTKTLVWVERFLRELGTL